MVHMFAYPERRYTTRNVSVFGGVRALNDGERCTVIMELVLPVVVTHASLIFPQNSQILLCTDQ